MFGIGFTELLLIFVIAILFLGPDKLPQALIDMAKFIKKVKASISDAKSTLEEEMKIADLKEEALSYKKQLDEATDELKNFKNINFDDFDDNISYDEVSKKPSKDPYAQAPRSLPKEKEEITDNEIEAPNDTITFKKKEKVPAKESKGDA